MIQTKGWEYTPHYIPAKGQPVLPRSTRPWIEQSMTTGSPLMMDGLFRPLINKRWSLPVRIIAVLPVTALWIVNFAVVGVVRGIYRERIKR